MTQAIMPHAVRCTRFSVGNAYSLPVRAVGIPAGGARAAQRVAAGRAAGHTEKEPPIPIPIPIPIPSRKQNGLVWLNMVGVPAGVIGGLSATQDEDSWFGDPAAAGGAGAGLTGIGFGVDYSTGAAYKLDPARIVVKLEPVRTADAR